MPSQKQPMPPLCLWEVILPNGENRVLAANRMMMNAAALGFRDDQDEYFEAWAVGEWKAVRRLGLAEDHLKQAAGGGV